jgi:beta-lactam-binding protein with PASTA domain
MPISTGPKVKLIAKLVFLALVLIMVAMISALTAMRFAIHGHEVTVPNFLGMTVVEAERVALAAGLELEVEREYYSPTVPEGKIMSQVPDAGSKVRRGWQLRVAQSLGPQRVAIPDVTGETSRAAELTIERRGLTIGSTATLSLAGVPADQVIAQSPLPRSSGVAAPRISLLLATAPGSTAYVIPNLVGQSLVSATEIVEKAGMRLGTVQVAGDESRDGNTSPSSAKETPSPSSLVLSQNPAAGQKIVAGSEVNFEVSR